MPKKPTTPPAAGTVADDLAARLVELWNRLGAQAAALGGPTLALRPGASDKEIAAAEKALKLTFPPGFRASLRLHDGQESFATKGARNFPWLPGAPPLAPLTAIVERWTTVQGLAAKRKPSDELVAGDRIKAGLHRTGRIPIAGTPKWNADVAFLDLDPGKAGVAGQLITTVGDSLVVVDTSFEAALERWISVLERGLWTYDPARDAVHPKLAPDFTGHPAGLFSKR